MALINNLELKLLVKVDELDYGDGGDERQIVFYTKQIDLSSFLHFTSNRYNIFIFYFCLRDCICNEKN